MDKAEIEKARQEWAKTLESKATEGQKAEYRELKRLGTFSEMEIIFKVFGWRAPISQKIWNAKSLKQEKMGLNDAVYYLLRVVYGFVHPNTYDMHQNGMSSNFRDNAGIVEAKVQSDIQARIGKGKVS